MTKLRLVLLSAVALFATAFAFALSGNAPFYRSNLAATAVAVATKPTYLSGYNVANSNSAIVYVQFFDAASAGAVTVGTTAPTMVLAVPGNGVIDGIQIGQVAFQLGIVVAATTTATGSTAPATALSATIFTQ